MDGHAQADYNTTRHSPHPHRKTPAQKLCRATTRQGHPRDRAIQPREPLATCLQTQREELRRRILAGELDDEPLYISQPTDPSTAHGRRSPRHPPPNTAVTRCRDRRQDPR